MLRIEIREARQISETIYLRSLECFVFRRVESSFLKLEKRLSGLRGGAWKAFTRISESFSQKLEMLHLEARNAATRCSTPSSHKPEKLMRSI